MKATGIVRKLDSLGRVVIPKELRNTMNINEKDPLEIFIKEDNSEIILKKFESGCIFCGEIENLIHHNDKQICKNCLNNVTQKKEES